MQEKACQKIGIFLVIIGIIICKEGRKGSNSKEGYV